LLSESPDAEYADYDYDAISHALNVVALWNPRDERSVGRHEPQVLRKTSSDDRLEIGVLAIEKADEPEEISLGGFLTVVGEDDHPSQCSTDAL
jgi:hypothetical protein